ncbi:hypothetical protein HDU86_005366 [Geranomyces michiganensis]|nr:hypothetical protein HDU86_005366 [Geranomyces michiganensis]
MRSKTPTTLRERLAASQRANGYSGKNGGSRRSKSVVQTPDSARLGERKRKAGMITPSVHTPTASLTTTTTTKRRKIAVQLEDASSIGATHNPNSGASTLGAAAGTGTGNSNAAVIDLDSQSDNDDDNLATPLTLAERLKARDQAAGKPGKKSLPKRQQERGTEEAVAVDILPEARRPGAKASKASATARNASLPAVQESPIPVAASTLEPADVLPATPVTDKPRTVKRTKITAQSNPLDPNLHVPPTGAPSLPKPLAGGKMPDSPRKARVPQKSSTPRKGVSAKADVAPLTRQNPGNRSFAQKWTSRAEYPNNLPEICTCKNADIAASPWGFLIACLNRDICAGSTWYHPECVLATPAPDPAAMDTAARRAYLKGARLVCKHCVQTPPDWPAALTLNAAPPSTENYVCAVPLTHDEGLRARTAEPSVTTAKPVVGSGNGAPVLVAPDPAIPSTNGSRAKAATVVRPVQTPAPPMPAIPQPNRTVFVNTTEPIVSAFSKMPDSPGSQSSTPALALDHTMPILPQYAMPGFGGFVPPTYSDEDEADGDTASVFEVLDEVQGLLHPAISDRVTEYQKPQLAVIRRAVDGRFWCPVCPAVYKSEKPFRNHLAKKHKIQLDKTPSADMSHPPPLEMVSLADLENGGQDQRSADTLAPSEPNPNNKPSKPARRNNARNSYRQALDMSELPPHRASHLQFATAAESSTSIAYPPPAYAPAGPPPRYIPPRRLRGEYAAAEGRAAAGDGGVAAAFGFESSEESDIRPAGMRWWMITIIGCDLVFSTLLLFLTLASLSQSSLGPVKPAAIVLPFVYVFLSAWGKSGVSRDWSVGKIVFTVTYLMRWMVDIAGVVVAIRASDVAESDDDNTDDVQRTASPMAWTLEIVRVGVVGMRAAQSDCVLDKGACTWRLAAWGGMLVFNAALALVLMVRLYAEHRYVQGKPLMDDARPEPIAPAAVPNNGPRLRPLQRAADDGFRTSVLTFSSNSSDGSTLNEHPGVTHHISIAMPQNPGAQSSLHAPHEKEDNGRLKQEEEDDDDDDDDVPLGVMMQQRDGGDKVPLGVVMQRREVEDDDPDLTPLALILRRLQAPPS